MSDIDGEVIYVQGVSDPTKIGQYPVTQATVALVVSILGLTVCCLLPPVGLMMSKSALEITNNYPGHPDQGIAKAANVVSWVGIGILIMSILFMIVYFIFLGALIAISEGA
tara:strand:+ start:23387 stop:23719 length:333 start_codon:yes stop_codon:yes gene_type:complete